MSYALRPPTLPEDAALLCARCELSGSTRLSCAIERAGCSTRIPTLGGVKAVGEQLHSALTDTAGEWVAVLVFAAAAKHLPSARHLNWLERRITPPPPRFGGQQRAFPFGA